MNKGRVSTQVLLCVLMMLLLIGGCSTNDACEDCVSSASSLLNSFSISGKVSGTTGVTINVTGAATTSVTTDSSGAYTITGLANGKYTITPVKAGYIFTPSSVAVTVSGGDVTVADITATADSSPQYSISGTVTGATNYPVMVLLSGDGSATVWTDASGNYTFPNLVDGNYTVTPSLSGCNFNPASQPATVSGADVAGLNFTTTSVSYTQGDLTGIWNVNILRKGASRNEWERMRISVDSAGVASCSYYGNSSRVLLNGGGTLSAALDASATSFSVNTGAVMPDGAVIVTIDTENIAGTYDSGTHQVTSCIRGYGGTTAAAHSASAQVIYNNPSGEVACPTPFDLTLTMAGGVVTPGGTTAADLGIDHLTMTSSKNLISGTGTITGVSYQLAVMQKEPRGTLSADLDTSATSFSVNNLTMPSGPVEVQIDSEKIAGIYNAVTQQFTSCIRGYSSAAAAHSAGAEVALVYLLPDVQNKTFVYHQLQVGNTNQWEYGAGQASSDSAITLTSRVLPSGSAAGQSLGVSFVLSTATGRVDISGTVFSSFQGFLSDDKKTIVATYTDNITDPTALDIGQNDYHLVIYQINDQTYTAGALPAATYLSHLLGVSSSQYGWGRFTTTVAGGGGMTFSGLVTGNISFTLPAATGSISASGVVTKSGTSSYNGQMSNDKMFIVGTQTLSNGAYALEIDTK